MSCLQAAPWLGTGPDCPDRTIEKYDISPYVLRAKSTASQVAWNSSMGRQNRDSIGGKENWVGTGFASVYHLLQPGPPQE